MLDQINQQIEHLRLDSDVFAVPPELAAADIQHMVGEDKLHLVIPVRAFTSPRLRGEVGLRLAMRSIVQCNPGEGDSPRTELVESPPHPAPLPPSAARESTARV